MKKFEELNRKNHQVGQQFDLQYDAAQNKVDAFKNNLFTLVVTVGAVAAIRYVMESFLGEKIKKQQSFW